jgi:hypothetical protein
MGFQKKRPGERLGNPQIAGGLNYSDVRDGARGVSGLASKAPSLRDGIPIPDADPKWKPAARSWFNSLKLSGQSQMFEASDWATAVAAANAYDVFMRTWNSSVFAQFVRLSERLGATLVDRKRARIELEDPAPADADEEAADAALLHWHGRLAVVRDLAPDDGDDRDS